MKDGNSYLQSLYTVRWKTSQFVFYGRMPLNSQPVQHSKVIEKRGSVLPTATLNLQQGLSHSHFVVAIKACFPPYQPCSKVKVE